MSIANVDMAAAWDGPEGEHWVARQDVYETSSRRYRARLLAELAPQPTDHVLDIGCGCGLSTREIGRLVPQGGVVGADLSSAMLARGRELAAIEHLDNVEFVQADAQVHDFGTAAFDIATSAFGGMFFADPVAAYANIGRALRPGARLVLMVWRGIEDSEWVREIAGALLGAPFTPPPGAPGPLAFGDPSHVRDVLSSAGFVDVELVPVDESVWFGADPLAAYNFLSTTGMARGALANQDETGQLAALGRLRTMVGSYAGPDGVQISAGAWLITAVRG